MASEAEYTVRLPAALLSTDYRPSFAHQNKIRIFESCCAGLSQSDGAVVASRWGPVEIPERLGTHRARLVPRGGVFRYERATDDGEMHWHLNFAHFDAFAFYDSPLLAQDEHQVLEHPALASVREALLDRGHSVLTTEDDRATPLLVSGVERRVEVSTEPGPGRPLGLYGNRFSRADWETIRSATRVIDPPTISNILAMEAPACGGGRYGLEEIRDILGIALTGFAAAVGETAALRGGRRVVIHTGFWGCGAYGGNHVLMAALQVLGAHLAGVDEIIFYTFDEFGDGALEDAVAALDSAMSESTEEICQALEAMGFEWGESDGN